MTDVAEVAWDLSDLLRGSDLDELLHEADRMAEALAQRRGQIASFDVDDLRTFMEAQAELADVVGRAASYAHLRFATDTADPANGARLQKVSERLTTLQTKLLFFELEWAAVDHEQAESLLAGPGLDFCGHHLRTVRRYRDHLLSEPEEKVLTEKSVSGAQAWVRLFSELTSALKVELDGRTVSLEEGLSSLTSNDGDLRRRAAEAITAGLAPGLRTRAYIYNTLALDKSVDDRLRNFPHWLAQRNMDNQASDESVQALIEAVRKRYDIPQRWYTLKARLIGVDRIADYDRLASVAEEEDAAVGWDEARGIVLDSYASFSSDAADIARAFFDRNWIDAPVRPAKQPGAFCEYTVPSVHPYVLLNWTSRRTDVLTLAHELGHGLHSYLARGQGVFHQSTPLTLAETASVFGETVVFGRLLEMTDSPSARLALLAQNIEGAIATVFRQTAMNRFEDMVHNARRTEGELSIDRIGELWADSQTEMLGDSVDVTDGYRTWWSYIPHFIASPGYVYAYAYGQLLALSVYRRYEEQGPSFVPRYLELLAAGGSDTPETLARIVDCDLADPGFWDGGLDIIEQQLQAAETAAREAGRI